MTTNLDYLINMGRTYRRDDDTAFGFRKEKKQKKKNKHRKADKDFFGERYNVAGAREDREDDPGFEKFTNAKRKNK
jgi:hypothetical protein